MSEKPPLYVVTATQFVPDPDGLTEWERKLLDKIRLLRSAGKRAILEITEQGIILVFVLERAGRVE